MRVGAAAGAWGLGEMAAGAVLGRGRELAGATGGELVGGEDVEGFGLVDEDLFPGGPCVFLSGFSAV